VRRWLWGRRVVQRVTATAVLSLPKLTDLSDLDRGDCESAWLLDSIPKTHDWPQLGAPQQKQRDEQEGCPSRGRRATGEDSKVTCSLCGECERAAGWVKRRRESYGRCNVSMSVGQLWQSKWSSCRGKASCCWAFFDRDLFTGQ
jgi:hypothetical protein